MIDETEILSILQHGDSFFPTGSVSFSWGIETLINEEIIKTKDDVELFLINQLTQRWIPFDRVVLHHAYERFDHIDQVQELDIYLESLMLNEEFREGSKKLGLSLLTTFESLGNKVSADYLNHIYQKHAHGHQIIAQGLAWKSIGLSLEAILYMSAYSLCVNSLGAALRLGKIGHIESQSILSNLHSIIIETKANDVPGIFEIKTYTPCIDIASMQHEIADTRLFIN